MEGGMSEAVAQSAETTVDLAHIKRMIPHRYPFLLIDRVEQIVKHESAVGIKNVTNNEPFFQGHFPDKPIMPGVMIVEAMAQTDLDKRIHRNQQTKALGRMSFGILQTFWNRLNALKGVDHLVPDSYVMNQIEVETEPQMVGQEIREHERPPMLEVESYRLKQEARAREAKAT